MQPQNVLITGGSGFIGSHIVNKFTNNGTKVTIFDINEPQYETSDLVTFYKGDIFNLDSLEAAIDKVDTVVHLVGLADSSNAQKNPMKSFELNIVSLQNVLEICRKLGDKKIIFPSSAAVYGTTDDLPIKENQAPAPTNVYSWHKYVCEKMILSYQKNYGLQYVILRFFNVYGKGNEGVIGIFLDKGKKGEMIDSFGPFQYRDFVYSGDVAEAVFQAVTYDKAVNRIINIGSGRGMQIREILEIVCEIYPEAKWREMKADFTMYDSIADITLAKILLDFNPDSSREFMKKIIVDEMI